MGVKKLDDGRWRARYRDDAGKEHVRLWPTKAAATRWLDEVSASLVRGDYVDPRRARVTVGAWADGWLAGRVHLKPKTVAGYESLLETRIRPRWGSVPLVRITNADVVAWVASMRAEGLSASRTRQAYHLLSAMLDAAVRDRRLPSNPAGGVDLPRIPKKERRYLSHAELAELAVACDDLELLVLVLGYTGLRYGEAAALRVRRVDTMRRRLEIVEAVTTVNGSAVFGTPKTHQTRSVPVPAFLNDRLVEHVAGLDPGAFVFAAASGDVLTVHAFRARAWDRACVAVGLGEVTRTSTGKRGYAGMTPHELRHTAASLAIASGASVKGIQAMLGHATASMTLDLYGHLFDDELDAVAARIDTAARDATAGARPADVVAIGGTR